ncbi:MULTISPECIES: SDR family oxidoreductase [Kitasatospora]|uniref:SDR family oxidoreductase n=1 Tax=Kitasatospora TaxID=2063 RepID=UPI000C7088E0|nr:SDR family oxidoreductase [Kitasatospora sp. GP30]MDH6145958.1 3-oxoacyl-[acyl-carrier protein] reductase [Kitasatospora sp. GP30]
MELGITGRTAVVCASTSGLGEAVAVALAAEGANVVVCGRRAEQARRIAAALPRAVGVGVDLLDEEGPQALLTATEQAFGPADILVLNGPGPRPARVTELREEELGAAADSLLTVHHRLVSRALPHMREQGWGRILAIGSSAVVTPINDLALSGIGRTALAAYLKMLAAEVAPDGVTVNLLLPGRIATDRVRRLDAARADRDGRTEAEVRAQSAAGIPMGRYGEPDEFGATAAFLCGEPASYLTGIAVRCDGGQAPVL